MRIVFAGTPALSLPVLEALLQMPEAKVVGVVSQPDRKAGRGMRLVPSPVKQAALDADIDVTTPDRLRENETHLAWLQSKRPDALVVVAFGMLLPKSWLETPKHGAINVHASLLPRWRGAAPIERAILAGDTETGVCIMQMDEGLDTGGIYAEARVPIGPETTTGELRNSLLREGADLLTASLPGIVSGRLLCQPQSEDGVTYASKLKPCERNIDWLQSAGQVDRTVRAFAPVPGARTRLSGKWLKILAGEALASPSQLKPGEVRPDAGAMDVGCGEGIYRISSLQPEGKKAMYAKDFLHGIRNTSNLILGV